MQLGTRDRGQLDQRILIVAAGVVLFLALGALTTPLPSMGPRRSDEAKLKAARAQIGNFAEVLDRYSRDMGRLPETEVGLKALTVAPEEPALRKHWKGPYLEYVPADPWGNPYVYQVPGRAGEPYALTSLGSDGLPRGRGYAADITANEP